ncbi:hypothetical protein OKW41_005989 [Paraburkholderia sp. UCT70]|uniref:hypothetical protein n=1 Tax=Paraburkholderia sp. UCT70 TaxID=2991068 RepID=UPI003D1EB10B
MKTQEDKFWLVWSPTCATPMGDRHPSFGSAAAEAERLAQANPGREFFVLGAEMSYSAIAMQRVEYFGRMSF